MLPVFINAAAPPATPTVPRVAQFGRATGAHLANRMDPRRILYIGSGGLSHDPPMRALDHPDPAVRERVIVRHRAGPEQRAMRRTRLIQARLDTATGTSNRMPLNAE